jgi:mitochondrial protein MSS2
MFIRNIYYGSKILAVGHQNINSGLIIKRLASSSSFEMPKIDQQILKNKFYKHLFFSMDSEVSFNDIKDVFKDIYYNIPKLFDHLSNNGLIKATKDDAVDESMGQKISQTIISLPETSMGNTFYTKMFLPQKGLKSYKTKFGSPVTYLELMLLRHALIQFKDTYKVYNKSFYLVEEIILKICIEEGFKDAVSIESFEKLMNEIKTNKARDIDIKQSQNNLKTLLKQEHPITLKHIGDLNFQLRKYDQCLEYYGKYLSAILPKVNEVPPPLLTSLFSKKRYEPMNPLLKHFYFLDIARTYNNIAKVYLSNNQIYDCERFLKESLIKNQNNMSLKLVTYYLLGLIYSTYDPVLSKQCFQIISVEGFKESFKHLGNLELNYFGDASKASNWFELGVHLEDFHCYVGLFDASMNRNDLNRCYNVLDLMQKRLPHKPQWKPLMESFVQTRGEKIKTVQNHYKKLIELEENKQPSDNMWNL